MLRARALEQALRMLIDAAVQTACKIAEDGDRRWHVVDLVCATNDAEKLLAVDPPPSGASPQATGGYIHHSLTDWIPTPGCDCDRCTSARKSAPKPTGGASPQAETRRDCTCLGTCRGAEGLGPRWKCALETPAPVSPVEPTPAILECCACGHLNTPQQATRLEGEWRSSGEYVCLDSDACARRIAECSNPPRGAGTGARDV